MTSTAPADTSAAAAPPDVATESVLLKGEMPSDAPTVSGYDWDAGVDYSRLLRSYSSVGFQATNLGRAIEQVDEMLTWRLSDEPYDEKRDGDDLKDPSVREKIRCTIFLGYTSNLISSGIRETFLFLAKHRMIDCIVTTAGGVEEDFIKCLAPTYLGDFRLKGETLRKKGINRIGNLLVPNDNYCKFENWMVPVLDEMLDKQKKDGAHWTPSKMIELMGERINDESSVYYWCWKNKIPVFCPAITDGSIGDMIYFHSYRNPGLIVDIAADIRRINDMAARAKHSGMIILGGGLVKHHICNANLMRNGADYSVFINTASEYDGSDSGAAPDEAISWGKIRINAEPVKVHGEATLLFPLLVAETFAKKYHSDKAKKTEAEA